MIDVNEISAYALALSSLKGIGPKAVSRITEKFPTSDSLTAASTDDLKDELGDKLSRLILTELRVTWRSKLEDSRGKICRHRDAGIIVLAINDVAYPTLLKRMADPPTLLYLRGSLSALSLHAAAVVGTRSPTSVGVKIAEKVSGFLANAGYTIVSGLAKGIDTCAHRGCLSVNGTTIAVLANPLDSRSIYPAENRSLAEEILERSGALISETPLGQLPQRSSFVQRDRIQSGLSLAVFAIQTDVDGGTMHTVRYAERDNRLLFCPIPLDGDRPESAWAGIRLLLRTNRAQPFDKATYEKVLMRLQVYEPILMSGQEIPAAKEEEPMRKHSVILSEPLFAEAEEDKREPRKEGSHKVDSTPTTLTPLERLQLANQFEILEKMKPEEAEHYASLREIVERGYTIRYEEVFNGIYDEMSLDECKYVYDVLDMHRALINSFNELKDKQGLTAEDVKFKGFDGNNESKRHGFVRYLQKEGLWTETLVADLNSHSMMTMKLYPRMLRNFEPIKQQILDSHSGNWLLTAEQIRKVIS
jgi:DNA protecting protein DprA